MRFSVWLGPSNPWHEVIEAALHAERTGWDGLWYADHYMGDTPDGTPNDTPLLECWTVLPALAAAVPRLRIGPLVSPTTVHHPALLAKRAATLDRISGGRFVLGIGAGWQVNEHRAYGFDLMDPRRRVDRFAEGIEIVYRMLREQRTTVGGEHFQVTDAPCEPKPVQEALPILVGSAGPRMQRLTARWADEWNTWGTPEHVKPRAEALDRACEAEGRDPATIRRSAQVMVFFADDATRAEKLRSRLDPTRTIVGSSAHVLDTVGRYRDVGVEEFIVPDFGFGPDPSARREIYDRFDAEVATRLR